VDLYFPNSLSSQPPLKDLLAVCPDELTRENFLEVGLKTELLDYNLWNLSADVPVRDWSLAAAESWRLDENGNDFTLWRGRSLARCLEGIAWSVLFGPLYRVAHGIDALLAREKPARVHADAGIDAVRAALLKAICAKREITLTWHGSGTPFWPATDITRRYCTWSLTRHAGKKKLVNAATALFRPRKGRRVLASYYFTLHGMLEHLGAESGVVPAFFDWPGKRLLSMRSWTKWRLLTEPEAVLTAQDEKELQDISARWQALSLNSDYARRFNPDGLPVWDALRPLLDAVVKEDMPFAARHWAGLERALDAWTPELVVVPYDGAPPERMLLHEARRRGIPSAVVLHGIPGGGRHNRLMDTQADHVFIGGPAKIATHEGLGVPTNRIHATGFPLLDRYANEKRVRPAGPPQALLISQGFAVRETILPVVDALRRYPDLRIVVKTHPGELLDLYRPVLGTRLDARCRLESRWNLSELLRESALVITGPSSALLEAMALKLPILLTNLTSTEVTPPFTGNAALPCRRTPKEVEEALAAWLPDRLPESVDHTRTIEDYAGKLDGNCGRRTVDGLLALLKG
jgi:hypothetical protein